MIHINLNDKYDKMLASPYKNLELLYKHKTTLLCIIDFHYESQELPFELQFIKFQNGLKYYRLIYNELSDTFANVHNIAIDFVDINTGSIKNEATISSIKKSLTNSGSYFIKLAIKICKFFKCKKIFLEDASKIYINKDTSFELSMLLWPATKMTYYTRRCVYSNIRYASICN
jgi:hypothetical protein